MTGEQQPATPVPHDRRRRVFADNEGRRWEVYEALLIYDRRGGSSLVFDAVDLVRRVRSFPPDWFELPDSELMELSERI